jgi:hypothetical protein
MAGNNGERPESTLRARHCSLSVRNSPSSLLRKVSSSSAAARFLNFTFLVLLLLICQCAREKIAFHTPATPRDLEKGCSPEEGEQSIGNY